MKQRENFEFMDVSGYVKNLFTVRAKKGEYVISKTVMGFVCGAMLLVAYFVGAILGLR